MSMVSSNHTIRDMQIRVSQYSESASNICYMANLQIRWFPSTYGNGWDSIFNVSDNPNYVTTGDPDKFNSHCGHSRNLDSNQNWPNKLAVKQLITSPLFWCKTQLPLRSEISLIQKRLITSNAIALIDYISGVFSIQKNMLYFAYSLVIAPWRFSGCSKGTSPSSAGVLWALEITTWAWTETPLRSLLVLIRSSGDSSVIGLWII